MNPLEFTAICAFHHLYCGRNWSHISKTGILSKAPGRRDLTFFQPQPDPIFAHPLDERRQKQQVDVFFSFGIVILLNKRRDKTAVWCCFFATWLNIYGVVFFFGTFNTDTPVRGNIECWRHFIHTTSLASLIVSFLLCRWISHPWNSRNSPYAVLAFSVRSSLFFSQRDHTSS